MKRVLLFGLSLILVVLISGCTNPNADNFCKLHGFNGSDWDIQHGTWCYSVANDSIINKTFITSPMDKSNNEYYLVKP